MDNRWEYTGREGALCTGVSHSHTVDSPVSRFELAGKLGPLLLMLPLQVTDGERDAFLPVGSQASALWGGRGAGWWRQRAATCLRVNYSKIQSNRYKLYTRTYCSQDCSSSCALIYSKSQNRQKVGEISHSQLLYILKWLVPSNWKSKTQRRS